jgi:HSP20 family molecular chaperone IbpA
MFFNTYNTTPMFPFFTDSGVLAKQVDTLLNSASKVFNSGYLNKLTNALEFDDVKNSLQVNLAGFSKEEISVSIDEKTLFIKANSTRENFKKSAEFSYYLGDVYSSEDVEAEFQNGLLTLQLKPADFKTLPPKTISIKG